MRVSSIGSPPRRPHACPGRARGREGELLGAVLVRSPQERAHAGEELLEREGLRDVVVRAGVEPGDAVADLDARGQHEDREAAARRGAARRQTSRPSTPGMRTSRMIASGSPSVLERCERLDAVVGELDLVALELERAAERLAHGPFVVDDQDLHGSIVRFESEKSLRSLNS